LRGKSIYLWCATDVDTDEILAVWVSLEKRAADARKLIQLAKQYFTNKPIIYVNGSPSLKKAIIDSNLEFVENIFGPRNAVERSFSIISKRLMQFYSRWTWNLSIRSIIALLQIYKLL
jgi:transposase-like protein